MSMYPKKIILKKLFTQEALTIKCVNELLGDHNWEGSVIWKYKIKNHRRFQLYKPLYERWFNNKQQ
jgi:hypothetical protein